MLHPAGLSFVNNLMITIKSWILDLGLAEWLIVTEKYKILTLIWKDKACNLSHSLEREGVRQGVRERSHTIPSKAWSMKYISNKNHFVNIDIIRCSILRCLTINC